MIPGVIDSQSTSGPPPVTNYPLADNGTLAASFGFGRLPTDAPNYTDGDYTYTGAQTGGTALALPAGATAFTTQAVTVTSADVLSLEAEIIGVSDPEFSTIGVAGTFSSGGTPTGIVATAAIENVDGSTPTWRGTGISSQVRSTATAGCRVGIDFIGSTGAIRIKSTDGVLVSSATFTPPLNVTAYLFASDSGITTAGQTAQINLIVAAADYQLPCPAGAKNLLGNLIP